MGGVRGEEAKKKIVNEHGVRSKKKKEGVRKRKEKNMTWRDA